MGTVNDLKQNVSGILYSKIFEIEVCSIRDLEVAYQFFSKDTWIFRGHEKASWRLETSLERELNQERFCRSRFHVPTFTYQLERRTVDEFRVKAAKIGCGLTGSYIGDLAIMQHYGAKTRLLDFSWAFDVALCFAYANPFRNHSRAVWAVRWEGLFSDDRLFTLEGLCQSVGTSCQQMHIFPSPPSIIPSDDDIVRWGNWADSQIVQDLAGTAQPGILPVLLGNSMSQRMKVQRGLFLMPSTLDPFEQNLSANLGVEIQEIRSPSKALDFTHLIRMCDGVYPVVIKIVFPVSSERDIRKFLTGKGLSLATLYPDINGGAMSCSPSMCW